MNQRGDAGEMIARQHLERAGLKLLENNFNCRLGELDLIMRDKDELVIVEVRQRAAGASVDAVNSINHGKQHRIIQATRHWLSRHAQWAESPLRFDVVAIDGNRLRWIRNAFDAQ